MSPELILLALSQCPNFILDTYTIACVLCLHSTVFMPLILCIKGLNFLLHNIKAHDFEWRHAECEALEQFRIISLLSVEYKIFLSI